MGNVLPLGFGAPWVLVGLLALPLIWLIVRAVPNAPKRVIFPPTQILAGLPKTEETPARAPPWLALLRALTLAMLIVGLSGPVWNPPKVTDPRDVLIVLDNGWTSAPNWRDLQSTARDGARSASGQVRVVLTAPSTKSNDQIVAQSPTQAANFIAAQVPEPLLADHRATLARLASLPKGQRIIWITDNIGQPGTADLTRALSNLGALSLIVRSGGSVAITGAQATSTGYQVTLAPAPDAKGDTIVEAISARGRRVAVSEPVSANSTRVTLPIDSVLMRDVAALRVANARSAGGTYLLDAFDRPARVGLLAGRADDQPLLSDAHYLEEALGPFAQVNRGDTRALAEAGLDAIVIPDAGALPETDETALLRFAEQGGLLIRFAGPKLVASGQSKTLPAPVFEQARSLKGALAWDNAGAIAPFERSSPFAGLPIPKDARVNQIAVLDLNQFKGATPPQIWARLTDATPVVSASPVGRGWVILFHTTAGPAWSDVAFSGLQVALLRRTLALANSSALPAQARPPNVSLKPRLVLDGAGNLKPPDTEHLAIAPQNARLAKPDARHPPGIYEGGDSRLILQAAASDLVLQPFPALPGVTRLRGIDINQIAFGPLLLALGLLFLLADMLLTLLLMGQGPPSTPLRVTRLAKDDKSAISPLFPLVGKRSGDGGSGRKRFIFGKARASRPPIPNPSPQKIGGGGRAFQLRFRPKRSKTTGLGAVLWLLAAIPNMAPHPAQAQGAPKPATNGAGGDVALAFLVTGDPTIDARARRGLEGLARALAGRTSVEPGGVVGVNPASDDLALYPLIYWLLPDRPMSLNPQAARALDQYMKTGGVLFVDTRGAGRDPLAARALTRTALRGIETPPLERVPEDHVLGKSFYLLRSFSGRFQNAKIWVETRASAAASANDGVSPLLVGDGDWASAWARAEASVGYQPRTRDQQTTEQATRVGVNVVLYALTGNYKADQVHFETLLQRLSPRNPASLERPQR